jgi:lipoprotein-anchoring transpeptidase ErfK/SrfK
MKRWLCIVASVTAIAAALLPASASGATGSWAHPETRARVRVAPSMDARVITRLHYLTEDGYPEVYTVYETRADASGRNWNRIGVPMRPNGTAGWVPASALGPVYASRRRLVINRSTLRAVLYLDGAVIWRSRVGVGKPGTPTPAGRFWIREKFPTHDAGGLYGPYAFGTSAYSVLSDWPGGGVIGIHGTDQPGLLPGRVSHGCVRLPNARIAALYRLMPVGTPVSIL